MAIDALDKKGTAYLQGIQGLNYLGKLSGYKKPMNILKSYLKSDGKRKTLYLKFNDGELEEVVRGVYQIKINPSDKNFLNDLRDELEDENLKREGINIQSGFLVNELKQPGDGGLLILDIETYQDALEIIKNDPMIKNNIVEWKLNEWIDITQ